MPAQYEDDHIAVCHGEVRQCLTCGGRMCDCGWPDPEYRLYRCIHCGANEIEDRGTRESGKCRISLVDDENALL